MDWPSGSESHSYWAQTLPPIRVPSHLWSALVRLCHASLESLMGASRPCPASVSILSWLASRVGGSLAAWPISIFGIDWVTSRRLSRQSFFLDCLAWPDVPRGTSRLSTSLAVFGVYEPFLPLPLERLCKSAFWAWIPLPLAYTPGEAVPCIRRA
jgi:hypothetical protein